MLSKPEFIENQERRCPCLLLLDISYSMQGKPIKELNEGIAILKAQLEDDPLASLRVEIGIVTFGGGVNIEQGFCTVDDFNPRKFETGPCTPMGEAIYVGLNELEKRKMELDQNGIPKYRSWIFLISDGEPTDEWRDAANLVHEGERNGDFSFFAIGVEGANMDILSQIAPPNRQPLMLQGMKFKELFKWISESVKRHSTTKLLGEQVELDPVNDWAQV